jgi:hypothetical protein
MVESGYIVQERSSRDRRASRIRLSKKGLALQQRLTRMHERHMSLLAQGVIDSEQMIAAQRTLRRLERFWSHPAAMSAARSLNLSDFGPVFASAGTTSKVPTAVSRH